MNIRFYPDRNTEQISVMEGDICGFFRGLIKRQQEFLTILMWLSFSVFSGWDEWLYCLFKDRAHIIYVVSAR